MQETLLQFHRSHFPGQPLPPLSHPTLGLSSTDALHELENNAEVDDVLGYYADGVKRTLSDEQVAIFRHTEIQELLRERRERAEADAGSADRPSYTGAGSTAEAPLAESRDKSSAPSSAHEKEKLDAKEEKQPCGNTRTYTDCLNSVSEQHDPDLDFAEDELGRALSVEPPTSMRINPCTRKIVRYEEDHLPPISDQAVSALYREESFK